MQHRAAQGRARALLARLPRLGAKRRGHALSDAWGGWTGEQPSLADLEPGSGPEVALGRKVVRGSGRTREPLTAIGPWQQGAHDRTERACIRSMPRTAPFAITLA